MANKLNFGWIALGCVLLALAASCSRRAPKTEVVTINNMRPRRDVNGNVIDAHGGCLQFFHGRFYLYGNSPGTNHVDTYFNCPFSVYSSPDLEHWTPEGDLLHNAPKGVYYRPYVVFDPNTKKYVLWYNWYQILWHGQAGVAVSDTPVGPFKIVNEKAHLAGRSPGDGSLFVDDDGTGYYIYTDIANNYAVRVEQLRPDFCDVSGDASDFIGYDVEAPVLFRRKNLYYALFGPLCAGCPDGSDVFVETAPSPLGPYQFVEDINHDAGTNTVQASTDDSDFMQTHGKTHSLRDQNPFIHAQETWVARLPGPAGPLYIWMADGWKTAPDGTRGHDFQYWSAPLKFNPDGTIQPLKYTPEWTITWEK